MPKVMPNVRSPDSLRKFVPITVWPTIQSAFLDTANG
jgi:hypothetical protein